MDAQGNPLYGDVFGLAQDDDDSDAGEARGGGSCTLMQYNSSLLLPQPLSLLGFVDDINDFGQQGSSSV